MERIGAWTLESELARGGMGVVWRAIREDGRRAALKTVRHSDARTRSAFRREARALARVRHPGVVRILDHGEVDGLPWIAMEEVAGHPLRSDRAMSATGTGSSASTWYTSAEGVEIPEPVAIETWTPERLAPGLDLFRRVCSALAGLHSHGLVHRDLKPDNALVRADGSVVLVDLGLVQAGRAGRDSVDVGELAAGTVAYMAPEQARGEIPDTRADLYALGCMLFEWLTGAPPYPGTTERVLAAHQHAPVPSVEERATGVPPALSALITTLLAKDPRERPGRVERVAAALEGLGAAPVGDPASPPTLFRPGLAGREAEAALLRERLGTVLAGGGAALAIRAPSGTGKTRLALELAREAVRGRAVVHPGECLPGVIVPFGPLRSGFEAIADRIRRDPAEVRQRVRGWALLGSVSPALAEALGARTTDVPRASGPLRQALRDALRMLAEDRPRVILLDDVQWADAATAAWVRSVVAEPIPGVFLLLTERPEGLPGGCEAEVLALEPLASPAAARVAADVLGLTELPEALRVPTQTPFHVTEWLRASADAGALVPDEAAGWRVADPAAVEALATTPASELVTRRLDALPDALEPFLEAAAVLGREVPAEALAAVADRPLDAALDALSELIARWILVDTADGPRFAHDQLLERAAGRISDERRALLHGRAAEALAGARAELRAPHLDRAGRRTEAAEAWEEAAREALQSWSWDDAARFAGRAAELSDPVEAIRIGAWVAAHVTSTRGRSTEAEREALALLERAEVLGDPRARVVALRTVARLAISPGTRGRARAWAEEAIALADEDERAICWESLATLAYHNGDKELGLAAAREARACYERTGDPGADGLMVLGLALRETGRLDEAEAAFLAGIPLWRASRSNMLAVAMNSLGGVHAYRGRVDEALACLEEALALHEAAGTVHDMGYTLHDLAEIELMRGRPDRALERVAGSRAVFESTGSAPSVALIGAMQLEALFLAGRIEEAARFGAELLAEMQRLELSLTQAQVHTVLGRLALVRGDDPTPHATAAVELAERLGQPLIHSLVQGFLAELATDPEVARAHADRAVEIARSAGFVYGEAEARLIRGRVFGDPVDLAAAAQVYSAAGNALRLAEIRALQGRSAPAG